MRICTDVDQLQLLSHKVDCLTEVVRNAVLDCIDNNMLQEAQGMVMINT